MRPLLIAVTAWSLLCAGPAFAQVEVDDPLTAMPSLGTTSPLGISPGGSVGPAGIPLDSTEITSLGVSPAPTGGVTGTIAIPASGAITTSGTTCSTGGMSPSGMYGFPWNEAPRCMIRDRDCIYGAVVTRRLRAMGIRDKPIAPASPWQNGFVERLIGSIRRECVDHITSTPDSEILRSLL
jgi:hypothetical protein